MTFDVEVSLALGADITADPDTWSWTDITSYVQVAEGYVTITRGRSDWQTQARPSTCTLQLDNTDGRFTRLNPLGAYYGQLTKNTPLRVRACATGGSLTTRFVGFVSECSPRWTHGQRHKYVLVRADGVLRRLGLNSSPIKSYARSTADYQVTTTGTVVGYWPLEDAAGATQGASGLPNGKPMTVGGTVRFAAVATPAGVAAAPDVSSGSLNSNCLTAATTTEWSVSFFVNCTAACTVLTWKTTGTAKTWSLDISATDVTLTPSSGSPVSFSANYADGEWHAIQILVFDSGANVSIVLSGDTSDSSGGSILTATSGRVTKVTVNPSADADLASVSHLTVNGDAVSFMSSIIMNGQPGTRAGANFASIATYNDLPVDVSSVNAFFSPLMGAFPVGTLLSTLQECADAAQGVMTERLSGLLGFDSHLDRENIPVTLVLDYDLSHIKPPFEPTDDDRLTRNDVTVHRSGGSFGHVELETGPMGTDPETGAGPYPHAVTLNLFEDEQAIHHAGWLVNLGTVNEYRYPLVHLMFHSSSAILTAWLACDIGSRITVDNLPAELLAFDLADQILEGYTELINRVEWHAALNLSPYKPYQVGVLAEDTMTLLTAEDTTSTTWRVACDPSFTTNASDLPVALRVDGEVVSVTAVSAVSVAVAAGTASHADNSPVIPVAPSHAEGDLMVLMGAIRSSGTGTVDGGITGWTSFLTFGNVRLFYRYASSSADTDPTVTFSGGAAGDTTSAGIVRIRGCQTPDPLVNSKTQLNGSAANIDYPYYVQEGDVQVFQFCWKQDDFTSVAEGFGVEVLEGSTTTGNDQSLYVVRLGTVGDVSSTATGSHTVTGGAAAISRAIWVTFLRGVADLTVTRSVNGVVTSHSRGATVQVDEPMNLAL